MSEPNSDPVAEPQSNTEPSATDPSTQQQDPQTDPGSQPEPAKDPEPSSKDPNAEPGKEPEPEPGKEPNAEPTAEFKDFTMPEGYGFSEDMLGKFQDVAKELNLDQAGAQKLVDLAVEHSQSLTDMTATRDGWLEQLRADDTFGGANYDKTVKAAQEGMSKFATPELKEFLNQSGAGDNNHMIILFAKIHEALGEGSLVEGDTGGKGEKTAAEVMYPNQNKSA